MAVVLLAASMIHASHALATIAPPAAAIDHAAHGVMSHDHGAHGIMTQDAGGGPEQDGADHRPASCDAMPCCFGVLPGPCLPAERAPASGAERQRLAPLDLASHRLRPDERPPRTV